MPVSKAIHLLTSSGGLCSINKTNEGKTFCPTCLSILRQENSRDSAKALEEIAQLLLFIVAPIIGAAIAGATYKAITGAVEDPAAKEGEARVKE